MGTPPAKERSFGVKCLIRAKTLEYTLWIITLNHTLSLVSSTKNDQIAIGMNLPLRPTTLKILNTKKINFSILSYFVTYPGI